jgi:superfamily II DNA or RNA helicase
MDLPFSLRPYQGTGRDAVRAKWAERCRRVIVVMPVGTGKTELFLAILEAELAAGALGRALILAHRTELVDQPAERMRKHFPALAALGVGIVQADRNDCHARIVCGMVQTLTTPARGDALLEAGPITHLVVDEAHHGSADTYVWLLEFLERAYPDLRVLGVTATPRGGAGKRLGLEHIFPETAYTLSLPDAIKLGVLSPFRALGASLPVSFRNVGIVNGDYEAGKAGRILSAQNALEVVVRTWAREAIDNGIPRRTIMFTMSVEQAHAMADAFSGAGYPAEAIDGSTPSAERRRILDQFARGELVVLTNCNIFGEGFDLPSIACVIPRPTPSDSVYLQQIGRGLRRHPGKLDVLILDFAPAEARDLVRAQDVLPQPEAVAVAADEERVLDGRGVGVLPTGEVVDPEEVRLRMLDYLNFDPLAWHIEGALATAAIGKRRTAAVVINAAGQCWIYEVTGGFATFVGRQDRFEDATLWARDTMTIEDETLILKDRRWRRGPVSEKQIALLTEVGLPHEGLTKGEASVRLNHAWARRAIRRIGGLP